MFYEPELNNPYFDDCYFSYDDGLQEALYVFIQGNRILERFKECDSLVIAETGFGTGLNLMALMKALRDTGLENKTIHFHTVEKYPLSPERIQSLVNLFYDQINEELASFITAWKPLYSSIADGINIFSFSIDTITVNVSLFNGDVVPFLESLPVEPDAWFLDGHSPDKNPDMWNEHVLGLIGEKSGIHSTVATFSAAGVVKRGLRSGGFHIKRIKGFGGKRHMTIGQMDDSDFQEP